MGRVLVYAASGHQGAAVVEELLAAGVGVRAVARGSSADTLRAAGAEVVGADLADADALVRASAGVDRVVLFVPLTFDPVQMLTYGRNAIDAAAHAGVEFVVYNASICYPDARCGYDFFDDGVARIAAHALAGRVPAVVLRPPLYLDNLLAPWTEPLIRREGRVSYPVAAGREVPWTSHRNQARYVARALDRPELAGEVLDIADPDPVTGEGIAEAVGRALGRAARYEAVSPAAFGERVGATWGPAAAHHMATLYAKLGEDGGALLRRDYARAYRLLAPDLEPLAAWAARSFPRH